MIRISVKPLFVAISTLSLLLAVVLRSPTTPFFQSPLPSNSLKKIDIWSVKRVAEWRPCKWWLQGHYIDTLPWLFVDIMKLCRHGYIRADCYDGLNQMRRDFCDGVGIAYLLNATLVLPKFKVAVLIGMNPGLAKTRKEPPNKTTFILKALSIPTNTNIYLSAGDGLMEIEGPSSIYTSIFTKICSS